MMRQMFSMGERSGLQAGHFSTRILLLRSHDVVIDAVCGLALSCWKMQARSSLKETTSGWEHMLFFIPFSIDGAFPDV